MQAELTSHDPMGRGNPMIGEVIQSEKEGGEKRSRRGILKPKKQRKKYFTWDWGNALKPIIITFLEEKRKSEGKTSVNARQNQTDYRDLEKGRTEKLWAGDKSKGGRK